MVLRWRAGECKRKQINAYDDDGDGDDDDEYTDGNEGEAV